MNYNDNVVDFQQQNDGFSGQIECRGVDEHRLHNAVVTRRRHTAALHVDAGGRLASSVARAQSGDKLDRIEASVLGERVRNQLERVGVGACTVRVETGQRAGPLTQAQRQLDLWRTTTGRQAATLDQRAHHTQRVVQRTLKRGSVSTNTHKLIRIHIHAHTHSHSHNTLTSASASTKLLSLIHI